MVDGSNEAPWDDGSNAYHADWETYGIMVAAFILATCMGVCCVKKCCARQQISQAVPRRSSTLPGADGEDEEANQISSVSIN